MDPDGTDAPLSDVRVVERSRGVACAYAGHLLAGLGASTVMLEARGGSPLRRQPPLLDGENDSSAMFAYLSAGKRSVECDLAGPDGRRDLDALLGAADIFLDDTPVAERQALGLDPDSIGRRYPRLVHVSVLPFGAYGDKADWTAQEVNLIHASGEGYLLPNGLSQSLFPDRPPLKIYGDFAGCQGGVYAALSALSGLRMRESAGGQFIDVSVQDAAVLVGAFAIQRLGDGSLEHRAERRFRYGGVFKAKDGYIELLMLEDRQWTSFVDLMGRPDWALDERYSDAGERSRCGDEINARIAEWALGRSCDDIVANAQAVGVPVAKYRSPLEILQGEHERARGLFHPVRLPGGAVVQAPGVPFQFLRTPVRSSGNVPVLDDLRRQPGRGWAGSNEPG